MPSTSPLTALFEFVAYLHPNKCLKNVITEKPISDMTFKIKTGATAVQTSFDKFTSSFTVTDCGLLKYSLSTNNSKAFALIKVVTPNTSISTTPVLAFKDPKAAKVTIEFGPTSDTSLTGTYEFRIVATLEDYPEMDSVMEAISTFKVTVSSDCAKAEIIKPDPPLKSFRYLIGNKEVVTTIAAISDTQSQKQINNGSTGPF